MKKIFLVFPLIFLASCATQADILRFQLAREQVGANQAVKEKIVEGHYKSEIAKQARKAAQAQSFNAPQGRSGSKGKSSFDLYEMSCEKLCRTCNTFCMEKCPELYVEKHSECAKPDKYPPKEADELMSFDSQPQAGMVSINIGDGNIGIVSGVGNDINTGSSSRNYPGMPKEFSSFMNSKVETPKTDYEKTLNVGERVFDKLIYPVATVIGISKITDGFKTGMREAGNNKTTNNGDIQSEGHEESPGSRNVLETEVIEKE